MQARADTARPHRDIRFLADDDDPTPIEEWTLDEVDSEFDLSPSHGPRGFDAEFD